MLRLGGQRFTVKPSALPAMDALFDELPNFTEVLEDIRKHLALCIDSDGLGRAAADAAARRAGHRQDALRAQASPQLLGTGFGFVPMSSLTAGWVLSGASSQWKNAKPGKVFDTFLNGDYANPVIVVDEIDKASGDGAVRPARRALRAARDRDRHALRRRVRRAADRRLGRGVARDRQRRRRASPSRCSAA